ncbi:potassium transporter Kup [uncultured Desulfosarcina sp.]|uniref:potassium transporter Kup n=1 Tax=uncultured Desulfosarcina sp. TaxID=218289 RepID=UPI0029C65CCF|nr:potassium transporter Kup [uncultured Desulfosarcina sp.]
MTDSAAESEKGHSGKPPGESDQTRIDSRLARLSLAALGVVFGDIATSPIYAIRECFHGEYGIAVSPVNVMGILSLMFWALVMIVGMKYLLFVFRANNRGEGGVIALTALMQGQNGLSKKRRKLGVIGLGLFAACLLYGDGMITPAISVLSAVEGIRIITPVFTPYVIPITVAILIGLFLIQRHGTTRVGGLFGPVILVWLCFLALAGGVQVARTPQVLAAVLPWHAAQFLIFNKLHGFVVLGAVFLVVTGTEALYADMGHFGTRPIRLTWFAIVLPALLLNYFGQGALLLGSPQSVDHPFYAMVPSWAMIPTVFLATLATIIASQAVISGAFSMTRQAIQLGFLPRLKTRHTSASQIGQIYVAPVNWMLMVCTIALVAGFQTSSKLAAAYGVAVTSTMIITTVLFFVVARQRWNWPVMWAAPLAGLFLLVDVPFFAANLSKILHGAWFPLVIGAAFFTVMLTWARGRRILADKLRTIMPPVHQLIVDLGSHPPNKIEGDAVFLAGSRSAAPIALVNNVKHNCVLHSRTVLLHFRVEDVPRVPSLEKVQTEKLGGGFYRIVVRYGFMEDPSLDNVFSLARDQGVEIDPETASFYISRENLVMADPPGMARWRLNLFMFLSRNAADATSFFRLPPDQVIEIGVRLAI